ncbi:MAG: heavy metal-binding domain-containing protein [Nitrososphaerales archaeon]
MYAKRKLFFAPKCGTKVDDDNAAFCPNCRTQLRASGARTADAPMLFTANYVPGYKIDKVVGLVYGITVRSRGLEGNIIAGLRTLAGAEITEYTEMAPPSKATSIRPIIATHSKLGRKWSAVFDSTEMEILWMIIAFGTAVIMSPLSDTQQYVKLS